MAVTTKDVKIRLTIENKSNKSLDEAAKKTTGIADLTDDLRVQVERLTEVYKKAAVNIEGVNQAYLKAHSNVDKLNREIVHSANKVVESSASAESSLTSVSLAAAAVATVAIASGYNITGMLASIPAVAMQAVKDIYNVGKNLSGVVTPGLIGVIEASVVARGAILGVSVALLKTDNILLKFIGTTGIILTLLSTGLSAAIGLALNALGDLSIFIGKTLVGQMEKFEAKFAKLETTMQTFSFVVTGFNKTMGEDAVGSLKMWEGQLESVIQTTTFGRDEIAKAIKLLVADASILGVTVEQNKKILSTAADIAAAQGVALVDVIQNIISALNSNGIALRNMGVDLTDIGVSHSKYAKTLENDISLLDEREKVQARVNVLFEKSLPIMGAAAAQIDTIAGSNAAYTRGIEEVQAKLGEQGKITLAINKAYNKLALTLLSLPPSILNIVGTLQDLFGVTFLVLGLVIKYTLTLALLIAAYKLLNTVVSSSVITQSALTAVFKTVGGLLNVQIIQVTSLSAAFTNLNRVLIAGILSTFKSVAYILGTLTKAVWGFLVAISPLLIKLGLIVVAIVAVKKAIENLVENNEVFRRMADKLGEKLQKIIDYFSGSSKGASKFSSALEILIEVGKRLFDSLVAVVELLITGVTTNVLLAARAWYTLKSALNSNEEDALAYQEALQSLDTDLMALSNTSARSISVLARLGDTSTALAGDMSLAAKSLGNMDESSNKAVLSLEKLARRMREGFDPSLKMQAALGDEFDQLRITYQEANLEYGRALDKLGNSENVTKELIENAHKAREKASDAYLSILKRIQDANKDLSTQLQQSNIEELRNSGKLVEASRLEGEAKVKAYDDMIDGIRKLLPLTDKQLKNVTETRKAIEAQNAAALKAAADEQARLKPKGMQELLDMQAQNIDLQTQALNIGAEQVDIIERNLQGEIKKLDVKTQELLNSRLISDEMKEQIKMQAEQNKNSAKQLAIAQKAQLGRRDVVSKADIDGLRAAVSDGAADFANQLNAGLGSFAGAFSAVMGAITGVISFAQQVVDAIPQVIDSVTKLVVSITDLPKVIETSLLNLFQAIPRLFSEFIPNLLAAIPNILQSFAEELIEKATDAILYLILRLPDLIIKMLERLPDIIERIVSGLIAATPVIAIALVETLVRHAPRIAMKMMEFMAVKLPIAIIKGIVEGFKRGVKMLMDVLSGKRIKIPSIEDIPEKIANAANNIGKAISNETSQIFQVKNLEEGLKGLGFVQQISAAVDLGVEKLKNAWQWLIDAWRYVYNTFLKPFLDMIRAVWQAIWDNFLRPIVDIIRLAWKGVIEFFDLIFKGRILEAFAQIWEKFKTIGGIVWDGIKAGFMSGKNFLQDMGKLIWEGLKTALGGFGKFIMDIFDKLNPKNLFERMFRIDYAGKGTVEKALNIDVPFANFATGGLVPGKAITPGDSLLNDRILALLSPGEAIIPRTAMQVPEIARIVEAILDGTLKVPRYALGGIGKAISGGAKSIGGTISGGVKDLGGAISGGAKDLGGMISAGGKQALKDLGLDPAAAWRMVQERLFEAVMRMFRENAFATGGLVMGSGFGDSVPAMLTPGEFVVKRQATKRNFDALNTLNNTGSFSGGGMVIEKIEINAKTNLDADGIRREVIPAIEKHLKRASLDGKPLIAASGVFTR